MDGGHMKFDPSDDRYIYEIVSKNIKYFRLHNNSRYSSFSTPSAHTVGICSLTA